MNLQDKAIRILMEIELCTQIKNHSFEGMVLKILAD